MNASLPSEMIDYKNRPPHLKSHFSQTTAMPWMDYPFKGIQFKTLFKDDETGISTLLFIMEPGAIVPLHEHTALEQTYVLEGSLEDDEGKALPEDFVRRPGGNIHEAIAPNRALILSVFMKPNKFFSGAKFFTELLS